MSSVIIPGSGVEIMDAKGGAGGRPWDHGYDHEGMTEIHVKTNYNGISYLQFKYVKTGELKRGSLHAEHTLGSLHMINIAHPREYLVSVEGWYDSSNVIKGIIFKTSSRDCRLIGKDFEGGDTKFTLQIEGKKIIGFHGSSSGNLNSLGAYFVPIAEETHLIHAILTQAKQLEGVGGDGGSSWDDGLFNGVRKVYVEPMDMGIAAVKFEYDEGDMGVVEYEHGKCTGRIYEKFELDFPNEYITAVDGTFNKIFGSDADVITMLRFTTNNRKSIPFGVESGTPFSLKEEGYKIVGFHGKSGDLLHKVGVYAFPVTN